MSTEKTNISSETNDKLSDKLTDKGQAALKRIGKKKRKKIIKTIILSLVIFAAVLWFLINSGYAAKFIKTLGLEDTVKNAGLGNFFKLQEDAAESMYTTYTVGTRTITQVLSSTGTIEPNDQYSISGLVSGEILDDYFNEGDTVIEDQVLYKVDSDKLDSSVTRAENSLKNANSSLENALEKLEKLNVESDFTGTVKKLYIEEGDEINQGTLVADIVDDMTMCIDIPFMEVDIPSISVGDKAVIVFTNYEETTGFVSEISPVSTINALGVSVRNVTIKVNNTGSITTTTRAYAQVNDAYCTADSVFYYNDEGKVYAEIAGEVDNIYFDEGERISEGQIIVKLVSEDLEEQIEDLEDAVEEAEDALQDAKDAFDDYNIKAPITGKVISKTYKTGDTLSAGQGGSSPLAVIYDMSALKFTMYIDELDIDKLEEGQDVIVTCDSRQGKQYHGTITNISIQGSTTSGTTVYPVEVTIENVEDQSQRTVSDDGTVNKVYRTGMTSTEKTYSLVSASVVDGKTQYTYGDDIVITKTDNILFHGDKELNSYLGGTYTQGSYFYDFTSDFSKLTLEIQNDKQMLRPGMNIDAEIIVDERVNVIAIPLGAVGRGNIVKVIKNNSSQQPEDKNSNDTNTENMPENFPDRMQGNFPDGKPEEFEEGAFPGRDGMTNMPQFENMRGSGSYGSADRDTEYEEVRITIGISDDDYVEVTGGLNVGDVVIIESQMQGSNPMMQFGMMGQGPMMSGGMGGNFGGNMGGMRGTAGGGFGGNMGGGMRGTMGR